MKFKILLGILAVLVLGLVSAHFVRTATETENNYINSVFKDAPYSLNVTQKKEVLQMQINGARDYKSWGKKTVFVLKEIRVNEVNHRGNELFSYPSTFTGYSLNGQFLVLSDAEIVLVQKGELFNRLYEKDEQYTHIYTVSVERNGTTVQETLEISFIKNFLGEFNKPTYYCNPLVAGSTPP